MDCKTIVVPAIGCGVYRNSPEARNHFTNGTVHGNTNKKIHRSLQHARQSHSHRRARVPEKRTTSLPRKLASRVGTSGLLY